MVRNSSGVAGCLVLRGTQLNWGERTFVMGIVNATPDSFSGDGRERSGDAIVHALAQWSAGADVIDIGGESTRPGHRTLDDSAEIARVVPVIEAVRSALPDAPISVDTYKPAVLRAARRAGADLVNSVWGALPPLLDTVAELEMPIVIMQNQHGTAYDGPVVDAVLTYLEESASRAIALGITPSSILLDPGIGFGKTADQNLEVLAALPRLTALGFATMLGTSRKSTIGKLTGKDVGERVYGTVATTALAIAAGVDVVRVHDVKAARDAVSVSDAIVRGWRPESWTE